jgi:acetyl esterase/lipase
MLSSPNNRFLLSLIAIVLLAGLLSSRIQTAGGRVVITDLKIPTQNGQWVAGDLFKPRSATAESPAPLVVVVPGFQRSREALANIAIELARRGIVVISIDPYAQGRSSSSMSRLAATTEGYGMFAVVDYAASSENLNYIDKSRIATSGHSAGGNAAIRGGNYFGKQARPGGKPSKLHSVYVSGYVLTLRDEVLRDVRSNIGVSYALYDEGAYRNELKNADMRLAPEALRVVNLGRDPNLPALTELETGRYYGQLENRTLRVVHNERILHPFQPYMAEATANQLEFFEKVFELDFERSSSDQVWYWKEILGAISLIAALVSLIPLSRILLEVPYFCPLVARVPPALPRAGGKGKMLFWAVFVFAALVACFSYIPMAELSQKLFVEASTRQMTWFFPQRMNNAVMLWALLNGSLGYLLFFGSYHFYGKHHGVRPEMWGAGISRMQLFRTFIMALSLYFYYFLLVFVVYFLFHV